MKIVTWNCNGALRNKVDSLNHLNADILVIQECEDPSKSTHQYQDWAGDYLWVGTSKNKGIGVFPKNGYTVEHLKWDGEFKIESLRSQSPSLKWKTSELELFLPFTINNTFIALGVWTKGKDSNAFGYMGQFWKYLQIHGEELSKGNTFILGDFNSNTIWDKQDRWWSHTDVVNELDTLGLESLYHIQQDEEQGKESQPTFFLHRHLHKPYHIDYAFVSKNLSSSCFLEVGKQIDWLVVSDHMPLVINIK